MHCYIFDQLQEVELQNLIDKSLSYTKIYNKLYQKQKGSIEDLKLFGTGQALVQPIYREFHEKGTPSYLCLRDRQIVSIGRVYTPSTFYMKSAVRES